MTSRQPNKLYDTFGLTPSQLRELPSQLQDSVRNYLARSTPDQTRELNIYRRVKQVFALKLRGTQHRQADAARKEIDEALSPEASYSQPVHRAPAVKAQGSIDALMAAGDRELIELLSSDGDHEELEELLGGSVTRDALTAMSLKGAKSDAGALHREAYTVLYDPDDSGRTALPSRLRRSGEAVLPGTDSGHKYEHALEQATR